MISVNGFMVFITTTAGQTAATVATNLASVVSDNPTLQSVNISSVAIGGRVVTNGIFDLAVSADPGIMVPEPGMLVMLAFGVMGFVGLKRRKSREWQPGLNGGLVVGSNEH